MVDSLLNRSASLRQEFFESQTEMLERLAREGQRPEALFIGCSDARVTPERLLGAAPGDLFMLRNIANIVPPYIQTEIGIVSVLEYAVLRLKVPHIIVCGHTDCGGIKGLDSFIDMTEEPALSRWLDLARPAKREVEFRMGNLTGDERHIAIVEQNVLLQLMNVQSYPFIRRALEANQIELHGWVYHLKRQLIKYYDPKLDQFVNL